MQRFKDVLRLLTAVMPSSSTCHGQSAESASASTSASAKALRTSISAGTMLGAGAAVGCSPTKKLANGESASAASKRNAVGSVARCFASRGSARAVVANPVADGRADASRIRDTKAAVIFVAGSGRRNMASRSLEHIRFCNQSP